MSITKERNRAYQQAHRAKTLNIGISRTLVEQLRNIRSYTTFKSDNETLKYLLDLEKDIREKKILEVGKVCDKCGEKLDVKLDSYIGITHKHVDAKSNCLGCIRTKYNTIIKQAEQKEQIVTQSGSTVTKEGQGEQKDQQTQTEAKDQEKVQEYELSPGMKKVMIKQVQEYELSPGMKKVMIKQTGGYY